MSPAEAAGLLGVEPPDVSGCRSVAEAEAQLEEWHRVVVAAAWRREVRLAHPDRATSEQDRVVRERRTRRLNVARDVLREVRVVVLTRAREQATSVRFYWSPAEGLGWRAVG